MRFHKITIIGVGLLGGSLGLAIKRRKLAHEVFGYVRRAASVAECKKFRVADVITRDLWKAVAGADLIILCTPLAQMRPLVRQMLPALKAGAIITDVGSVKSSVVEELESLVAKAGAHFVGSHPMAGAEKTGVAAARSDLFEKAVCVLTPTKKTNVAAVRNVEQFWKSLGARVLELPPEQHDLFVARTSHLPHLVAATLASFVLNPSHPPKQSQLCANGFRDTTRIASGSPEMWRDIILANRKNLRVVLDNFVRELQKVQALLRARHTQLLFRAADAARIEKFFAVAKQRREVCCVKSNSPE